MITINRKSWHYRFLKFMEIETLETSFQNLCSYFSLLIISMMVLPVLLVVAALSGLIIGTLLGAPIAWGITAYSGFFAPVDGLTAIGFLVWGIIIFVFYKIIQEELNATPISTRISNTLIGQYIIAKKQKYCPMIEFK